MHPYKKNRLAIFCFISFVAVFCTQCLCSQKHSFAQNFRIDTEVFKDDLSFLTAQAHPFGSDRQKEISDYIVDRLSKDSVQSWAQPFSSFVPVDLKNAGHSTMGLAKTLEGQNVLGFVRPKSEGSKECLYILGSHYDTKIVPGIDYVGANDSGSSSVLLLQLMRYIQKNPLKCGVLAIWFDGEESVLWGWDDGKTKHPMKTTDNTYGSRHFVDEKLQKCSSGQCWTDPSGKQYFVSSMVLLDMVGSKNLSISLDSNSDQRLQSYLLKSAKDLGRSSLVSEGSMPISDDHLPFIKKQIPALNIIDFNNIDFWHAPGDVFEQVSADSLQTAGRLALQVLSYIDSE